MSLNNTSNFSVIALPIPSPTIPVPISVFSSNTAIAPVISPIYPTPSLTTTSSILPPIPSSASPTIASTNTADDHNYFAQSYSQRRRENCGPHGFWIIQIGCGCDNGYYSYKNQCLQCPTTSQSINNTCLCQKGYIFNTSTGQCVTCPEGTYELAGSCLSCPSLSTYDKANQQCVC
jgi:hypothetical protein